MLKSGKKYWLILLALLNSAQIFLITNFEFIPSVNLLGFRVNSFLIINIIFCFIMFREENIKDNLTKLFNKSGKLTSWLLTILLLLIVNGLAVLLLMLVLGYKFNQADYFFEFGVTSFLDIPVYFLWTLPLILSNEICWRIVPEKEKLITKLIFILLYSLSFGSIIFSSNIKMTPDKIAVLIGLIFSFNLFLTALYKRYQNIWINSLAVYLMIYFIVVIFGSTYPFLIKTFFANNYDNWSGILFIKKEPLFYLSPAIVLSVLYIIPGVILSLRKRIN